jgi:hypothetical protein
MKSLILHKSEAIRLRKLGYSYNEIRQRLPVSKSSLSVWLRNTALTQKEKSVLKRRVDGNISLGRIRAASALHSLRLERDSALLISAKEEFANYKKDLFFFVGLALYWAEGSKRDSSFIFTNSDSDMICVMLVWIERFFSIARKDIHARLYLHKPYAHERCEEQWSRATGIPLPNFKRTVYKPTGLLIKKRPDYSGCLRIEIGKVAYLRKYHFWQKMMLEEYRKQGSLEK